MNRRGFLSGMLAAGAAPFVVTADGQLLTDDGPLVGTLYGFGAPCDDWAVRSAGALLADRLDTQASIDLYAWPKPSLTYDPRYWVLDTSIKSGC